MTRDTEAIQQAIDSCFEQGGGTVLVPEGIYLITPIRLRSNVRLHLEKGATLLGSPNHEDYPEWQSERFLAERSPYNAKYLIIAEAEENISITGEGVIDGQAGAHYGPANEGSSWWSVIDKTTRPGRMIWFALCRNIRIEGIFAKDAPAWTFWMLGCESVVFHKVTIRTPYQAINTDGIDIDCCRDVSITNCDIRTGDDAVVLRAKERIFLEEDAPTCEMVHVENCLLASNCQAIRLSYIRDGIIRNVTMNNLTIYDTRRGIICQVPSPEETPENRTDIPRGEGPVVENISFTNIRIEALQPLWFYLSDTGWARRFSNIRFENLFVQGTTPSLFKGTAEVPMENFSLKNIHFRMVSEGVLMHVRPLELRDQALTLSCAHCANFSLQNIIVDGDNTTRESHLPVFYFESMIGLEKSEIQNRTNRSLEG